MFEDQIVTCANCAEDFVTREAYQPYHEGEGFCSPHCLNQHRGEGCPAADCLYCQDNRNEE